MIYLIILIWFIGSFLTYGLVLGVTYRDFGSLVDSILHNQKYSTLLEFNFEKYWKDICNMRLRDYIFAIVFGICSSWIGFIIVLSQCGFMVRLKYPDLPNKEEFKKCIGVKLF